MQNALGHVAEAILHDAQLVDRLSDHQLAGGQRFVFHQHELENLPGVTCNTFDAHGPVWLAVERLIATHPPAVDSDLAMWIDVPSDPDRRPLVRQRVTITVQATEKDQLIAAAQARAEQCAPASGQPASAGLWSVRLHLEHRPDVVERLDRYLAGSWAAWAAAERPRRRSIALHHKLRDMARVTGAGRNDASCEIVWGVGVSRWRRRGRELDLPLLERLVEIEVLDGSDAEIRIRPRMVGATVNLRAFEPLTSAAKLASNTAEQLLERGAELSPFEPASFEPILSAIGSQLDPDGIYCPGLPDAALLLPEETEQLVVSDRWVIFARPRSDGLLLRDIKRLQRALDYTPSNEGWLTALAHRLIGAPEHDSHDGARRRLSSVIGDPIDIVPAAQVAADRGDLFFPLPTNSDQMEIVRQLRRSDGLVVKGAAAPDRTSAVANVVCHHLALGLRVLVVSRNESALSALSEKLPRAVRELTVDLTGSDKDVLKHAESVVSRLLSILDTTDLQDQAEQVNRLERDIIATSHEITRLDDEVADIAGRTMLRSGTSDVPFDALATMIADRETYAWFTDRPLRFLGETDLIVAAVEQARAARLRLGGDIEYLDDQLPEIALLPDAASVMRLHADLQPIAARRDRDGDDGALARQAVATLEPDGAGKFADDLDALAAAHRVIADEPWLAALSPVGPEASEISVDGGILVDFARDASSLLSRRAGFLVRPVDMPADAFANEELLRTVERLSAGEKAFTTFSLSGRALKPTLDTIKVAGFSPKSAADWAHVRDYLTWRRHLHSLDVRWRSLAAEIGAPTPEPDASNTLHGHERIVRSVEVAIVTAALAKGSVLTTVAKLSMPDAKVASLLGDSRRLAALASVIRSTAGRVGKQRRELERLNALFQGCGAITARVQSEVLSQIGRDDVDPREIETRWGAIRRQLQGLHERRQDVELINEVCQTMTEAGASAFARRIRTEPATADGGDPVLVADWMMAWNWAVLIRQTAGDGQQQLLQDLSDQRVALETRLRELFEQVVVARMHLALAQNTSGAVRQAFTMFTTTLRKIAATCSGPSAFRLRQVAREVLENCHEGIPCQLMPAWRVAEQLPARLDAFDLVVIDDASRSDLRELTVLLRGRKILAVAEDRASDETVAPGDRDIAGITHAPLGGVPISIRQLMPPKTVLCDFLNSLFPERVIRLREHARRLHPVALPMAGPPQQFAQLQTSASSAHSAHAAPAAAAEHPSPAALPVAPPAYSLEDEIATVAESLSLARREQRDEKRVLRERPAPDWLRSGATGSTVEPDASSLDAPSAALPAWIGQADPVTDSANEPRADARSTLDETAEVSRARPANGPEKSEATPRVQAEPSRSRIIIDHQRLSARLRPALDQIRTRPRPALRRYAVAAAAVLTITLVTASIFWQPTGSRIAASWHTVMNQFAASWNAASPAAALPASTEPRKVTAERMMPDARSTAETLVSHAVLYQEDPQDPGGKRYLGKVTWHVEPAAGSVPASIKGDVEIDKQMKATLSLRPNKENDMPASHILEVKFNWPGDPSHAGVDSLKGVSMKAKEAGRGAALSTLTAKVTPEFFMIALSANEVDKTRNVLLLKGKEWIDIPIVYNGGSRAVLAIEKGAEGERAFTDAFTAWGQ
ncbi:hypothetical protein SSBR45G_37350 [Bradyrhizobium sp. SSBR45G]|nr:hypothetical protein SSBR45G_37350 [Bradyrhizobium sp. SSBR45G]GLH86460.1 hypothetical protein SSBR45R_39200 [Bradyrhizobium sp. SSBR45R]